jgi:tRNA(Arg) A34 adenosine deaminase TadA
MIGRAPSSDPPTELRIAYPAWVAERVRWGDFYASDAARMAVAIGLARWNVLEETGGPFGAAVFERESGRLVSVGMNLVVPLNNSALHAEMVAFMMAQARIGSYTLAGDGLAAHELVTSCEPCAMCLGATLWSGVRRLVCGATRDDALRLDFDEGPVFDESYEYLATRGIEISRGVMRDEAAAVLALYRKRDGVIYNA